jgi:Protein of unknown function (DUF2470)
MTLSGTSVALEPVYQQRHSPPTTSLLTIITLLTPRALSVPFLTTTPSFLGDISNMTDSTAAAADAAAQQRIIKHMNADHHESIVRYLQHYLYVKPKDAQTAELTKVSLTSMTITTDSTFGTAVRTPVGKGAGKHAHIIPLSPPLKNYGEARLRMVAMDKEALEGLGYTDLKITTYTPPDRFGIIVSVVVFATLVLFSKQSNMLPGHLIHDKVLTRVASAKFIVWLYKVQPQLFWGVLAIHGAEVVILDQTRLKKYRVRENKTVWALWCLTHFLEGVSSFTRFDNLVKQKRTEAAEKNH